MGGHTYSSEGNTPPMEGFNLPNLSSFCPSLVFLEGFERGRLCEREHVRFHITYSFTQQPVKTVWRRRLADSRTHVKPVFVCAWRCQRVCGCSLIVFYFSVSFRYYEWKRQNTCLRVWTCWHGVWCFPFIFLSLFSFLLELLIIPSDTQTFLLYIEPCENWRTLPRLIGFMYCMTEACARRHKASASQDQHLLLGNTHSCSNL